MTNPPRTKNPIESFGPEILAALLKGSREEVRIKTTYREGVAFRMRLHQLRHIMQRTSHALYPAAARTKIILQWGERAGLPRVDEVFNSKKVPRPVDPEVEAVLTLRPHDSEFTDALKAAGVEAHELSNDPLLSIETVDDMLASYEPKPAVDSQK